MKYTPNFSDPRCRSRAVKALTFVEQFTRATRVDWLSIKEIYKHFGNTSRALGHYLKELLLEPADPYYNPLTGVCKKYRLRSEGVNELKQQLGLSVDEVIVPLEIEQQIKTGDFDYDVKSDRLYTAAQFIPRRYRTSVLANHGYKYHFDIEAAAPTMLAQRAQQRRPKLKLPALEAYIQDRARLRQQLAQECRVSEEKIKTAINSILQGGVLSRRLTNKTFMALNYDYDAVIRLNNNDLMISLKKDIAKMWQALKEEMPRTSGKITPRDKAALYRAYENQVGKEIRKILKRTKMRFLWIHDGWACDQMIDPVMIEQRVRQLTGFKIKLDWAIYDELS